MQNTVARIGYSAICGVQARIAKRFVKPARPQKSHDLLSSDNGFLYTFNAVGKVAIPSMAMFMTKA